jgi:2-keto-3-deoxy-L-rhamnonate aldolase RhmA
LPAGAARRRSEFLSIFGAAATPRAVAATRYPPAGIRGVSVSQRSNRYGSVADYFAGINAQISVMVQIESRAGLRKSEAWAHKSQAKTGGKTPTLIQY